uniref:WD domain, G-beta repeat n=1 Tax=Theileria annulata TaxID=5874 RepID=A0A3B0MR62_THEAN
MQLSLLYNLHLDSKYSRSGTRYSAFAKFGSFTSDGSYFSLTLTDNSISFYNVDEDVKNTHSQLHNGTTDLIPLNINPFLTVKFKNDIRDFCWFPNFDKNCPDSCCFLIASRNKPINLYDSLTGAEHFTYKPINAVGEIAESYSIDFHPLGKYFLCGSLSCIYVFDIQSPGEHIELRRLSTRKSTGQKGIISTISHNNFGSGNTYACGSYNCSVSIYDHNLSRTASLAGDFLDPEFPLGPITHIKWIDESKLIIGCRNDYYLRLYDTRGDLSSPLQRFYRPVNNNQKITFDYKDNLLVSG